MLLIIDEIDEGDHKVKVTLLDIDELGLVVSTRDLDLKILSDYHSIVDSPKTSSHEIIFALDLVTMITLLLFLQLIFPMKT